MIYSDGTDLEFRINSRVITVLVPAFSLNKHNKIWVDLQMRHVQNQSSSWNVTCGVMDNAGTWDLNSCIANTLSRDSTTHCLCPSTGTFAVFLTARAVRVSSRKIPFVELRCNEHLSAGSAGKKGADHVHRYIWLRQLFGTMSTVLCNSWIVLVEESNLVKFSEAPVLRRIGRGYGCFYLRSAQQSTGGIKLIKPAYK